MSAPDTDIEKQKTRHRTMVHGLWAGVAIAVIVAVALAVSIGVFESSPTEIIPPAAPDAG